MVSRRRRFVAAADVSSALALDESAANAGLPRDPGLAWPLPHRAADVGEVPIPEATRMKIPEHLQGTVVALALGLAAFGLIGLVRLVAGLV